MFKYKVFKYFYKERIMKTVIQQISILRYTERIKWN